MATWLWVLALIYANLALTKTSAVMQQASLVRVDVGETVILPCFYNKTAKLDKGPFLSWYKQSFGGKPRLLSSRMMQSLPVAFHDEFENNARFSVEPGDGVNHLKITDVRSSDSATYYCGTSLYVIEFEEGIVLHVKSAAIQQSLLTSVRPGDNVTLNCTVLSETSDGKHSVYWFRSSREAQPGLIYTHGNTNGQCERRLDAESLTHSCVYRLSKRNVSLSDAGTYYCAVASCGEILFGNGTMLEIGEDDCAEQMKMLVFLSIIRTGVVLCCLLTFTIVYIYMTRHRPTFDIDG